MHVSLSSAFCTPNAPWSGSEHSPSLHPLRRSVRLHPQLYLSGTHVARLYDFQVRECVCSATGLTHHDKEQNHRPAPHRRSHPHAPHSYRRHSKQATTTTTCLTSNLHLNFSCTAAPVILDLITTPSAAHLHLYAPSTPFHTSLHSNDDRVDEVRANLKHYLCSASGGVELNHRYMRARTCTCRTDSIMCPFTFNRWQALLHTQPEERLVFCLLSF